MNYEVDMSRQRVEKRAAITTICTAGRQVEFWHENFMLRNDRVHQILFQA